MKKGKNKNKQLLRLAEKFKPWDFGYMLKAEKQMLKQMQEYHSNSNITVDNPEIARQIKWAIKLLNIADETNSAWKCSGSIFKNNNGMVEKNPEFKSWLTTYINTKNWKRFITFPDKLYKPNWNNIHMQDHLRQMKAWYLYNRLRYLQGLQWWD